MAARFALGVYPISGGSNNTSMCNMNVVARKFNTKSVELNGAVTSLRKRKVKSLPFMMGL